MFHHLVSPSDSDTKGKVVGIDHIQQLVEWSVKNLKKDGLRVNEPDAQIEMICGDGRKGIFPPCSSRDRH